MDGQESVQLLAVVEYLHREGFYAAGASGGGFAAVLQHLCRLCCSVSALQCPCLCSTWLLLLRLTTRLCTACVQFVCPRSSPPTPPLP